MKRLLLSMALVACFCAVAFGQGRLVQSEDSFLVQLQERDSVLIGDQLCYGFHLKDVPAGTSLMLPDFSKGFTPGDSVEIVRPWQADTLKTYGPRKAPEKHDIDFSLVITSFEEGTYTLPALYVALGSGNAGPDTVVFKPLPLEVFTIPVDTATYKIHDIKGQIRYPVTFAEVLPYLAAIVGLVLLALLIRALIIARRRKASPEEVSNDPPYLVALRKLEKYRSDKYWARDKQKAFYSGITDALREYIDARYGIDAPEMTTAELFDSLGKTDVPADLYVELKELFETADLVKFAKAFATDEENASAVPLGVRFVTSTMVIPGSTGDPGPAGDGRSKPAITNEGGTE